MREKGDGGGGPSGVRKTQRLIRIYKPKKRVAKKLGNLAHDQKTIYYKGSASAGRSGGVGRAKRASSGY